MFIIKIIKLLGCCDPIVFWGTQTLLGCGCFHIFPSTVLCCNINLHITRIMFDLKMQFIFRERSHKVKQYSVHAWIWNNIRVAWGWAIHIISSTKDENYGFIRGRLCAPSKMLSIHLHSSLSSSLGVKMATFLPQNTSGQFIPHF